jgi:hypothetical protein
VFSPKNGKTFCESKFSLLAVPISTPRETIVNTDILTNLGFLFFSLPRSPLLKFHLFPITLGTKYRLNNLKSRCVDLKYFLNKWFVELQLWSV